MKFPNILKISRKSIFNPRAWFGVDELKAQHQFVKENIRTMFKADKPTREETFEEAVQRLGLSDDQIKQKIKASYRNVIIFCLGGFIVFFYAFYLLFRFKYILPWLMGLSASGIFFAYAFKFHFWICQMRERKLGMTAKEWLNSLLGVKSVSP